MSIKHNRCIIQAFKRPAPRHSGHPANLSGELFIRAGAAISALLKLTALGSE